MTIRGVVGRHRAEATAVESQEKRWLRVTQLVCAAVGAVVFWQVPRVLDRYEASYLAALEKSYRTLSMAFNSRMDHERGKRGRDMPESCRFSALDWHRAWSKEGRPDEATVEAFRRASAHIGDIDACYAELGTSDSRSVVHMALENEFVYYRSSSLLNKLVQLLFRPWGGIRRRAIQGCGVAFPIRADCIAFAFAGAAAGAAVPQLVYLAWKHLRRDREKEK